MYEVDDQTVIKLFTSRQIAGTEENFRRDVQFAFGSRHDQILTLSDFGSRAVSGRHHPFFVMPRIDETFRSRLDEPLELGPLLELTKQLLDGVEAGHLCGIPHGSLHPDNVLVDHAGGLHISDWGSCYFERPSADHYVAPEQKEDPSRMDARSDIYALGVMLRELISGNPQGSCLEDVVQQMTRAEPRERPGSIDHIKRVLNRQKEIELTRQKLDFLEATVIPYHQPDDPILRDPVHLTGERDYQDGRLFLKLSQPVTPGWVLSFESLGEDMLFPGRSDGPDVPRSYRFQDDTVSHRIDPGDAQLLVNRLKELIRAANVRYRDDMEAAARSCAEAERVELDRKIQEEKRRLVLLENLQI